jgi:hypothetical protein
LRPQRIELGDDKVDRTAELLGEPLRFGRCGRGDDVVAGI